MGLVPDSSVLIAGERAERSVSALLSGFAARFADDEFAVSTITVMELAHGRFRAIDPLVALRRKLYLETLSDAVPVIPVTHDIALLAAEVDAGLKRSGQQVATADLLIGCTALHLRYAIVTRNVRHFRMIPGLQVLEI